MPTPMTPRASRRSPDTIVLVHGFWVTPRSWEHWIPHYEAKGYHVIAPAYPGFEVEALNADPSPVERATVPAIIAHLESIVGGLDAPPIVMGHSAGGTLVQILLDHGFGAAGVTFNSAPTEGVLVAPWSQVRALFPVLKSPANRHRPVGLNYEQWRYTFANTFPEGEAYAAYKRYHVPASGGLVWDSALANLVPGPQATAVDYRNAARAPLLFVAGGEDHLMPPVVQHSNAAHYTAETPTEVKVFEDRSHLLPAQRGWEEIADYALAWAERHVAALAERAARPGSESRRDRAAASRTALDPRLVIAHSQIQEKQNDLTQDGSYRCLQSRTEPELRCRRVPRSHVYRHGARASGEASRRVG